MHMYLQCSYPGTVISGRMSSVKFYYAIGESITFTCDAGLDLRGSKVLKCLKNGKWSSAIPKEELLSNGSPPVASRSFHVNATRSYMDQLKSQIVRRRRKRSSSIGQSPPPSGATLPDAEVDISDGGEAGKGGGGKRLRGPCEDLDWDSFGNVTTLRPGKVPGRNAVGIMLHLECNAGFKLNIKGDNVTARCIRGIWKPETPKCLSAPCLVPAVEHGQYYKVEPHTKQLSDKPSLTPLSTYEEIQSNEFITLECEDGFNIQVGNKAMKQ